MVSSQKMKETLVHAILLIATLPINFILASLEVFYSKTRSFALTLRNTARALKAQVTLEAYSLWAARSLPAGGFLIHKRTAATQSSMVIGISIDLILWAAVGLLALGLLSTSSTTGLSGTVAFLAVTFVAIMATIAVAVAFFRQVKI